MKEQFITEQNRYAMNILESFGYVVNFNAPSRAMQETTTITIFKDGQKSEFLSSNTMLNKDYAVKFIEKRNFERGFNKGKEQLQNDLKKLLSL